MLDYRTETFLTCNCKTLNLQQLTKQLNITQPAVSQHIHFLEKQYNTILFNYKNKELSLTPSGQILYKHLLTMKNNEQALMNELNNITSNIETLSIGVTMTIGEYAIVDKLANFIQIIQKSTSTFTMATHLNCSNYLTMDKSVWLLYEGNYPKENYSHKKYSTEDYIAVCATSHQFNKEPHTIHDLISEHLLVREEGSGTRNILEQSLIAHGLHISNFIHYTQVENMHTIMNLLKKDCGISFLYKIAVGKELKSKELKEITLDDFKLQHDFDIIWEKESIYADKYLSISKEFI